VSQESGPRIQLERLGGLVRLVLDRPPLNVLNIPMLRDLDEALESLREDASVHVLLITGSGRAFCAGVDVADHTADRVDEMIKTFHRVIERLMDLQFPVVAAVNGAALGGGCELALACDVVLAREGAKLGQPEVRLGVFPPAAAVLLSRLVGRQTAADLILSGRVIEAEEALAVGLVSRVMPSDEFDSGVEEYAAAMASLSGPVLRITKRALREGESGSTGDAMRRVEQLYLDELMQLDDAHEGLAAFTEKRVPAWSGG